MDQSLIRDIIQWEVRSWSKPLRYWENAIDWSAVAGPCLEIGSRKGGLSLWLAKKGLSVVCSDYSQTESRASQLHERYGVTRQVQYIDIDATNIPFENYFDIIAFKSVLGAIGYNNHKARQQESINQIYKALKPGGKLLFAENLIATPIHAWMRKYLVGGYARSWRYISIREMQSFLKPFSSYELHATGLIALLGRTELQKSILAFADQVLFDWLSPRTWKYIIYGIASK